MIEAKGLTKCFDNYTAVDHIDLQIKDGSIFGLVGTNGAGKSTFMKLAAGILKPDEGQVQIDGSEVFENPEAKHLFYFISDDQYFFPNAKPAEMAAFYSKIYTSFDIERFKGLMKLFGLPVDRKIAAFSKGMKKQLSVIMGISSGTKYLMCDETFDGLDPVMRQAVKSLMGESMEARGLTLLISSHNLRELEDICDHVGLMHKGGILLSKDLDDMKLGIHKVQFALSEGAVFEKQDNADILNADVRGRLVTMTVRGSAQDAKFAAMQYEPVFCEVIPLTLEEIFIAETEVTGYDIRKLVL